MEINFIIYLVIVFVLGIVLILFLRKKNTKNTSGDESLESYIRKAIKQGHLEMNIRKMCEEKGWPKKLIDTTFDKVKREPEKKFLRIFPTGKIEREEDRLTKEVTLVLQEQQLLRKRADQVFAHYYDLKKREEAFLSAKGELLQQKRIPHTLSEEEKDKVLVMMDELLGKLPPEEVAKFSKSKDFHTYKNVVTNLKIKEIPQEKNEVERVLQLTREGRMSEAKARKKLGLPKLVAKRVFHAKETRPQQHIILHNKKKRHFLKTFKQKLQRKKKTNEKAKPLHSNQKLLHVVREALQRGYSRKQIQTGLKKRGWSSDQIQRSFMLLKR